MADRDDNRRPRWTNTGYWTDRPEDEQREGDRSRARSYGREDMRRYARQATEQGQRLRDLRGQRRENWDNESRYGRGAGMDRNWDYGGEWGQREPYRGYGTSIARGQPMGQRTQRMGRGFQYGWEGPPYHQTYHYREFWNVPGPYAGIGPSSYTRSDERITEEICEIFTYNGQIDATGIEIEIKDGEVILRGDVDSRDEKYLAEDIAASVRGVKDVTNQIRVQADDGARVRGMGYENVVMIGRIQEGQRVAGVDGKHIGKVRQVADEGFWLDRADDGQIFVPFRAVKRTNGQIILHIASNQIDQQNWKY